MTTDVDAGKDLGTLDLTITDEMIEHYIKGLDEPNPWYTTTSSFGGPVAPVIVSQDADSQFKGSLGGRLDVKFTNVLWPDEPFTTRGVITGRRAEGGHMRAEVHGLLREGRRRQDHRCRRERPGEVLSLSGRRTSGTRSPRTTEDTSCPTSGRDASSSPSKHPTPSGSVRCWAAGSICSPPAPTPRATGSTA